MNFSVKGKKVHFDDVYLHVELEDGRVISTPMSWYPELQKASFSDICKYKIICNETGIEWEKLDYHLNINSMLLDKNKKDAA